jgi:hypothetical protein
MEPVIHFNIEPKDLVTTWVEQEPLSRVPDNSLIRKFHAAMEDLVVPPDAQKLVIQFFQANGQLWGQDHEMTVNTKEVRRQALVYRAFNLLRGQFRASHQGAEPPISELAAVSAFFR